MSAVEEIKVRTCWLALHRPCSVPLERRRGDWWTFATRLGGGKAPYRSHTCHVLSPEVPLLRSSQHRGIAYSRTKLCSAVSLLPNTGISRKEVARCTRTGRLPSWLHQTSSWRSPFLFYSHLIHLPRQCLTLPRSLPRLLSPPLPPSFL